MALFSLKRIFDREAEIIRLRRANKGIQEAWLSQPYVCKGELGGKDIILYDPLTQEYHTYEKTR